MYCQIFRAICYNAFLLSVFEAVHVETSLCVCHAGSAIVRLAAVHQELQLLPQPVFIEFFRGGNHIDMHVSPCEVHRWWLCWVQSEQKAVCGVRWENVTFVGCFFLFSGFLAPLLSHILCLALPWQSHFLTFSLSLGEGVFTHMLLQFVSCECFLSWWAVMYFPKYHWGWCSSMLQLSRKNFFFEVLIVNVIVL